MTEFHRTMTTNLQEIVRIEYRDGSTREIKQNAHHETIYRELGLGKRLPDEGHPGKWIHNVWVWVRPRIPGVAMDASRTMCACPFCHKELTAGKLHQHLKVHM